MLEQGQTASLARTNRAKDIEDFASTVGDNNPVHLDEDSAVKTRVRGRSAHGLLDTCLKSSVPDTKLVGPGTIYLCQSLRFVAPVYIGDPLTAEVSGVDVRAYGPVDKLETVCRKQDENLVFSGEAIVLLERI